jgi:hypothetical protein
MLDNIINKLKNSEKIVSNKNTSDNTNFQICARNIILFYNFCFLENIKNVEEKLKKKFDKYQIANFFLYFNTTENSFIFVVNFKKKVHIKTLKFFVIDEFKIKGLFTLYNNKTNSISLFNIINDSFKEFPKNQDKKNIVLFGDVYSLDYFKSKNIFSFIDNISASVPVVEKVFSDVNNNNMKESFLKVNSQLNCDKYIIIKKNCEIYFINKETEKEVLRIAEESFIEIIKQFIGQEKNYSYQEAIQFSNGLFDFSKNNFYLGVKVKTGHDRDYDYNSEFSPVYNVFFKKFCKELCLNSFEILWDAFEKYSGFCTHFNKRFERDLLFIKYYKSIGIKKQRDFLDIYIKETSEKIVLKHSSRGLVLKFEKK